MKQHPRSNPGQASAERHDISSAQAEPIYAGELFGDGISQARAFVNALLRDSEQLGLLGPREPAKIWSRHVAHCALLGRIVPHAGEIGAPAGKPLRVLDIGSGAGFPGVPLAIARRDLTITLLEPMERRADWLRNVVAELHLSNVHVVRGRAEEHGTKYDIVTARAVAPLKRLVRWAEPLLERTSSAQLLLIKGGTADQEIAEAAPVLRRANLEPPEVLILGRDLKAEPLTVVRLQRRG